MSLTLDKFLQRVGPDFKGRAQEISEVLGCSDLDGLVDSVNRVEDLSKLLCTLKVFQVNKLFKHIQDEKAKRTRQVTRSGFKELVVSSPKEIPETIASVILETSAKDEVPESSQLASPGVLKDEEVDDWKEVKVKRKNMTQKKCQPEPAVPNAREWPQSNVRGAQSHPTATSARSKVAMEAARKVDAATRPSPNAGRGAQQQALPLQRNDIGLVQQNYPPLQRNASRLDPKEKRIDPDDHQAYTWDEFRAWYEEQYSLKEVKDRWASCAVLRGESAFLEELKRDPYELSRAPKDLRNNVDVVMEVVRHQGSTLQFASEELRANRDIVLEAVRNWGGALQYASRNLQQDEDIVLESLKHEGKFLRFADERLRGNKDVVLAAVRAHQDPHEFSLDFASKVLQGDVEVVTEAVQNHGLALEFASEDLKSNSDVVKRAVHNRGGALQFASDELRNSKDVVLIAVKNAGSSLKYASRALQGDIDIAIEATTRTSDALRYMSKNLRKSHEFAIRLVQINPEYLHDEVDDFNDQPDVVLEAVKVKGLALQYAADELLHDPAFIRDAVKTNGTALWGAPEEFRDNKEIVLEAVRNCGSALRYASAELRDDEDVVSEAIKTSPNALRLASKRLQCRRELVRKVSTSDHFRLGIRKRGMERFMQDIGYPDKYIRSEKMSWITEGYGDTLTGYDAGVAIRSWLKDSGNAEKSVCEVRRDGGDPDVGIAEVFLSHIQLLRMEDALETMDRATKIFANSMASKCCEIEQQVVKEKVVIHHSSEWDDEMAALWSKYPNLVESHVAKVVDAKKQSQSSSVWGIDWGKVDYPAEVHFELTLSNGIPVPIYWVDYCVLRQCQKDFDIDRVQDIIGRIGCTLVELDNDLSYLKRSFCILEIYATVNEGADLLCFPRGLIDRSAELFQANRIAKINRAAEQIDAEQATTRALEDKQVIDGFIQNTIGFEKLNDIVGGAIKNGLARSLGANVFRRGQAKEV